MQKASHTWRRPALRRLQNMQQKASQTWRRPALRRLQFIACEFRKQTRICSRRRPRPGAGPPRHARGSPASSVNQGMLSRFSSANKPEYTGLAPARPGTTRVGARARARAARDLQSDAATARAWGVRARMGEGGGGGLLKGAVGVDGELAAEVAELPLGRPAAGEAPRGREGEGVRER